MMSSLTSLSSSRQNQLRLAIEIQRNGIVVPFSCNRCFENGRECIAMPESRLKCSECTRAGRACVNLSWTSLDKTREEYRKKVDDDESLLAEVLARLIKNKKILRQAEERAKHKALCLASEMRDSGAEVDAVAEDFDCPAADALVGFSPTLWTTMGMLEQVTEPFGDGTGPGVVGSS
jgi:hypothetical protein